MFNDLQGYLFIGFFIIFSVISTFALLSTYKLNKKSIVMFVLLSVVLHFSGSIYFYYYSFNTSSDAIHYFVASDNYTSLNNLFSTNFIIYLVHWLRYFIFGNSYFGLYAFFAYIGVLGSTIYLIVFYKLLHIINKQIGVMYNKKIVKITGLLIVCWPSSMFWDSSIGKDSLCYFFIALFFLSLMELSRSKTYILPLIISSFLAFIIRPYLFLVGTIAFLGWFLFSRKKKKSVFLNIILLILFFTIFIFIADFLAKLGGFESFDYNNIAGYSIKQQNYMAEGTYIPVPTNDPIKLIFILPYLFIANLLLPMFFLARNLMGIFASIQNLFLLYLIVKFLKNYSVWKLILKRNNIINYMFYFFISGMSLLSMININLGLADREKLMYLPLMLIIMFITLLYSKSFYKQRI